MLKVAGKKETREGEGLREEGRKGGRESGMRTYHDGRADGNVARSLLDQNLG